MGKIYTDPTVRNVLNAYMQSVNCHDTGEVFLRYGNLNNSVVECAYWDSGKIMVRVSDGRSFRLLDIGEDMQNLIVGNLILSMTQDITAIGENKVRNERY